MFEYCEHDGAGRRASWALFSLACRAEKELARNPFNSVRPFHRS